VAVDFAVLIDLMRHGFDVIEINTQAELAEMVSMESWRTDLAT
jgi:hypothetical protein